MKITTWKIELFANAVTIKTRKNDKNTLIQNQQPKIDKINISNDNNPDVSTYENHAYVDIGLRNVDKTYYMLKLLEKYVTKDRFK